MSTAHSSSPKFRRKIAGFLKKALVSLSIFAVIFASFSCSNSSDDGSDGDADNLDLESYIFLRHRFVEENGTISYGDSESAKLAWSNKHFNDAKDYMIQKVADFKHKVRDLEPAGNFLQPICDEIWTSRWGDDIHGYENGGSGIDPIIGNNNNDYTKFMGAMAAKLTVRDNSSIEFRRLEAHYTALALRAYNDSLGNLRDSDQLPFNLERSDINNTLQNEPVNAPYAANDYVLIEQNLRGILERVSRETGVSIDTLVDAVNLNLLNVGMWGATNLSARAGFQLSGNNGKLQFPALGNLTSWNIEQNMIAWQQKYDVQYEQEKQQNQEQGMGL